jgi:hypothetical protein
VPLDALDAGAGVLGNDGIVVVLCPELVAAPPSGSA